MAVPYIHKMYSFDLSKEEIGELQDIYIFVKSFF
jgi:hypothetical protein